MEIAMKVTFKTTQPLTQESGMKMWQMGQHFMQVAGRATYQLTTTGTADDLVSGVEGATAAINTVVENDHPRQGMRVVKILAEEL